MTKKKKREQKATVAVKPKSTLPDLCSQIQELQRQRVCNLKSRIMLENRLVSTVAVATGYSAGMDEKERKSRFEAARKVVKEIRGESMNETDRSFAPHPCTALIRAASLGIDAFGDQVTAYEKEMGRLAKSLPVYEWLCQPEQRGFGLLSLSQVVGEAGDLNNYEAPGKLWKRLGCAPFESKGKMLMPSTWRSQKPGLSSEEWEVCGYSPRRRSVTYLIGEGLVKLNQSGPYRTRYDDVKTHSNVVHEDWKPLRHHRHSMLLATKLLLKNLWIEWTGGDVGNVTDAIVAARPQP